jgi:hypothetical protein
MKLYLLCRHLHHNRKEGTMKYLNRLFLLAFCMHSLASAEVFREWTQAETGNKIQAAIIGKDENKNKVTLRMNTGAVHVIDVDQLSDADKKYIELWMPPQEQLTCIITGKPQKGQKAVRITAIAGPHDMTLVLHTRPIPGTTYPEPDIETPWTYNIKAGSTFDKVITMENNYKVTAYWDGKKVDHESYREKTGRRD